MNTHLEGISFPLPNEEIPPEFIRDLLGSCNCRHLDVGSCNACDNELITLGGPHFDVQRFGVDFVASPRHADILLLTGPVCRNSLVSAFETFLATPKPRLVFAIGNCACVGGVYEGSYAIFDGAAKVLPIAIQVPGCPPTPYQILTALRKGLELLAEKGS